MMPTSAQHPKDPNTTLNWGISTMSRIRAPSTASVPRVTPSPTAHPSSKEKSRTVTSTKPPPPPSPPTSVPPNTPPIRTLFCARPPTGASARTSGSAGPTTSSTFHASTHKHRGASTHPPHMHMKITALARKHTTLVDSGSRACISKQQTNSKQTANKQLTNSVYITTCFEAFFSLRIFGWGAIGLTRLCCRELLGSVAVLGGMWWGGEG